MCIINCIKNMWFLLVGNTCIPVADSFWYLAKLIQLCKLKKKNLEKIKYYSQDEEEKIIMMSS